MIKPAIKLNTVEIEGKYSTNDTKGNAIRASFLVIAHKDDFIRNSLKMTEKFKDNTEPFQTWLEPKEQHLIKWRYNILNNISQRIPKLSIHMHDTLELLSRRYRKSHIP